jgi:aminoglycoside phosphotransferase (APT) family kinase protein
MYRYADPRLAAIVDWELATIGDPLLDMGWIMATWPDSDGTPVAEITVRPWNGFPMIQQLVSYYTANSERDTSSLLWYGVLGCYKLGIILEGTHARACAGAAGIELGERLHRCCVRLFQRALRWIE